MGTRVAKRRKAITGSLGSRSRQQGLNRIECLLRDADSGQNGVETLAHNDLAILTQAGSPEEARRAAEYLLRAYRSVILYKSRSFFMSGMDRDDMIQEGYIGLTKAMRDFRLGRRASFRTFADTCITRQMITAVKKSRAGDGHLTTVAASRMRRDDDHDSSQHAFENIREDVSRGTDPEDIVITREELTRLQNAIRSHLSEFENQVAELFIAGLTYAAIAETLECTPKSVDNALCRTRRKMRKYRRDHPND